MPKKLDEPRRGVGACLSVAVAVVALVVAVMALVGPTLHSCDVYQPTRLANARGVVAATRAFVAREGWAEFGRVWARLARSVAPPGVWRVLARPGHRGTVLVLGGTYIPGFARHAARLGVQTVYVDDAKARAPGWAAAFVPIDGFSERTIRERDVVYVLASVAWCVCCD